MLSCTVVLVMESIVSSFYLHLVSMVTSLYVLVDCPKGLFGIFGLVFGTLLFRISFRVASFYSMILVTTLSCMVMLADVVVLIGATDIVFGEVDK